MKFLLQINGQEKVPVRCRIHHWSTNLANRIPHVNKFWEQPTSAILSEQVAILETIPKKVCRNKAENVVH